MDRLTSLIRVIRGQPTSIRGLVVDSVPTTLDLVTLVIAVLGLLVSGIALTWQVLQHVLSGDRVYVELLWGGFRNGAVAVGPIRGASLDSMVSQGFTEFIFAVRGRNKGRQAVDVTGYQVSIDGGFSYSLPGWHPNPATPHRLEPGSSVTFYVPMPDVIAAIDATHEVIGGTSSNLRGTLDLGTGKTVHSGWRELVPPTS